MVEKLVRIYSGGHSHSHSHSASTPQKEEETKNKESTKKSDKEKSNDSDKETKNEPLEKKEESSKEDVDDQDEIKVAGYLNLAADAFHNFTDGLAIGSGYLAGQKIGLLTTVMILFHEIPHEVGDFAILIQSGVSKWDAIRLQLVTAIAAMLGCIVALLGAGEAAAAAFILPFTAGGFIYIATVSVIPELLTGSSLKQSLMEIVALLVGVFIMVIITWYE